MSALTDRWNALASRERAVITLLGVMVVLALAFLAFNSVGGSAPSAGPKGVTGLPDVGTTQSPEPTATERPLRQTADSFEGRDPFEPLVVLSTPGPSGSPAPSPGPSGGPSDHRVSLIDIFKENGKLAATVSVDDTDFTVHPGERFDDNFRLLSLTKRCGVFVFGDVRFSLCIGDQIRK